MHHPPVYGVSAPPALTPILFLINSSWTLRVFRARTVARGWLRLLLLYQPQRPTLWRKIKFVPFWTTCPSTLRASDPSTAYSTSRIRSVHNPRYRRKCSHSSLIVFRAM